MGDIEKLMNASGNPTIQDTKSYQSVLAQNIYDFMDNAYEGTGGFRDGTYLVPHTRELFYERRKDLAFYKNFVKPIVDAMVVPVFNKPIARKTNNDMFGEFLEDCDTLGTTLQAFMEDALTQCRLHGVTFIVVDNFPQEQQPALVNEALNDRIFPYVYLKKANQFKEAVLNKAGAIKSITFYNEKIKVIIEGKEKEVDSFIKYTENTTEIIYQDKNEWKVFETYDHNLGIVPVIPIYSVKRKSKNELLVEPPLYDLAKINLAIYNKDSEIRELERNQGFSIFYMQTDGSGQGVTVGTNNVLILPINTTIPPGFASPDASIQTNLMNYQKDLKEDLFRIAEQHGVTGVEAKSGIAIQWDFYAHESVLKKTSSIATNAEEMIAWIFGLYIGQDFDYEVHYPYTFQPNDKLEMIKITDMYLQFDLPPKARAMALEEITRLLFPNKSEDDLEEIIEEIQMAAEDETNANPEEGDEEGKGFMNAVPD